jgi:TolA-binding protein
MDLAWQLPNSDERTTIPPAAFGYDRVAHPMPMRLDHRDDGLQPDFRTMVLGDVPAPAGDSTMVRVEFINTTAAVIREDAQWAWEFGDGQSADCANPGHVYLRHGVYSVSLGITRGGHVVNTTNRVCISPQFTVGAKHAQQEEQIDSYLKVLEQCNAAKLGPRDLRQLVRAYLMAGKMQKAIETAKIVLSPEVPQHNDELRWEIITRVGPVARIQLADAETAAALNTAAAQVIRRPSWRFACGVEAADIALNELLAPSQAKALLDAIMGDLGQATTLDQSKYHRVIGDWYARMGNGKKAKKAYHKAASARALEDSSREATARRTAYLRSAEIHLQEADFQRARRELEQWQSDFPADKMEGDLSLLYARCWLENKQYRRALAVANDLLATNPNACCADRLVLLCAECEKRLKHPVRAAAFYQSLLTTYPESPLVPQAKQGIEDLWQAAKKPAASPLRPKPARTR